MTSVASVTNREGYHCIHPFVDGNGRTGCLIRNLMLMQAGYLHINVKYSVAGLLEERLTQYLEFTEKA